MIEGSSAESRSDSQPQRSLLGEGIHDVVGLVWHGESATRDKIENLATQFATNVPLFVGGPWGYVGSTALSSLNQAMAGDSWTHMAEDLTLGAAKGLAMKGSFNYFGDRDWNFATRGVAMGTSSRFLDSTISRQALLDDKGQFNPSAGIGRTLATTLSPGMLLTDVAAFGAASGAMKLAGKVTAGTIEKSPMIATAITGSSMGFTSGILGEIQNESQSKNYSAGNILWSGVEQGALMTGAAVTGLKLTPKSAAPVVKTTVDLPQAKTEITNLEDKASARAIMLSGPRLDVVAPQPDKPNLQLSVTERDNATRVLGLGKDAPDTDIGHLFATRTLDGTEVVRSTNRETRGVIDEARKQLTENLRAGKIDKAKEVFELNVLPKEEALEIVRTGFLDSLKSGHIHDAANILDFGAISAEYLKTNEALNAGSVGFAKTLEMDAPIATRKLMDMNLVREPDLQSEKNIQSIKRGLTDSFMTGKDYAAVAYDSLEIVPKDQISKLAADSLSKLLWRGSIDNAQKIVDKQFVLHEDLKSDSVREAARAQLAVALSHGKLRTVEDTLKLGLYGKEDFLSDPVRTAARERFEKLLRSANVGEAKALKSMGLVAEEDLQSESVQAAARYSFGNYLANRNTTDAKEVYDFNILKDGDLHSDEVRNSARIGLRRLLEIGQPDFAQAILDYKILTDEDLKSPAIRKAVRSGLAEMLGQLTDKPDRIQRLLDLNLHTAEDLKAEDVAANAYRKMIYYTTDGNAEGAKLLIDRNLISMEKAGEAAVTGLTALLAGDKPENAKAILDLNLMKNEDVVPVVADAFIQHASWGAVKTAAGIAKLEVLSDEHISEAMKNIIKEGGATAAIQTSLGMGANLDQTLKRYFGVSELNDETASKFYEYLQRNDDQWQQEDTSQTPFESGAAAFGAERMLRYVLKANASPHDALYAIDSIVKMYKHTVLSKEQFYGNILDQVNRDDAVDDTGNSFNRLNTIAMDFPPSVRRTLEDARKYPDIKLLQQLVDSFPDSKSVFESWPTLQRFDKLNQLLSQREFWPKLQELRDKGENALADWVEALAFHPDSRVSAQSVMDFLDHPDRFIDRDDEHSKQFHEYKKPSNYTDIPHLDMNATELRDSLINGTLDRLQVFTPMKVEYQIGGAKPDLAADLDRALGSKKADRKGEARSTRILFQEVNSLLKDNGSSIQQVLDGAEMSPRLRQALEEKVYDKEYGIARPASGMRLIAEIHKKSDPLAVLAGDDTVSCMNFGTGKNNVYMFNPNDALFTVRLVRGDGTARTIAQSVLTKDLDVKKDVPTIISKLSSSEKVPLHDIIPQEALRTGKSIMAADNIQVHPNYTEGNYPSALEAVYGDFFRRYAETYGESQNLRDDMMVIGTGYTPIMKKVAREPNTFVPQAPPGYSDKTGPQVIALPLKAAPDLPMQVLKVENSEIAGRVNPAGTGSAGVKPLTFEDTLPLAYLEGKIYKNSPSLRVGLHNMENGLIAKDINNTAKGRPNLSLKYTDQDGRMRGYLFAYEGKLEGASDKPVIYIGDFLSDQPANGGNGIASGLVAGKILLEFNKLYQDNYLDKGNLMPIFAEARDTTSYKLLTRQLESLGERTGYRFDMKEVGGRRADSSRMHHVLITPHRI